MIPASDAGKGCPRGQVNAGCRLSRREPGDFSYGAPSAQCLAMPPDALFSSSRALNAKGTLFLTSPAAFLRIPTVTLSPGGRGVSQWEHKLDILGSLPPYFSFCQSIKANQTLERVSFSLAERQQRAICYPFLSLGYQHTVKKRKLFIVYLTQPKQIGIA